MTDNLGAIAIIPARGGSKRVPGKNTRTLRGKPAIAYSIEAAIQSGLFDRVVVTTDSESIADVARKYRADVPFIRGADLADDATPVSLATLDALQRVDPEGTRYRYVAQLMANCPLRTADDVRSSCKQFVATGASAQISVMPYGFMNPWWAVTVDSAHRLQHVHPEKLGRNSQDLPDIYCPTGAIWWATADALRNERTFHTADKTGWIIPWQRGIDVDTQNDWEMLETLVLMSEGM